MSIGGLPTRPEHPHKSAQKVLRFGAQKTTNRPFLPTAPEAHFRPVFMRSERMFANVCEIRQNGFEPRRSRHFFWSNSPERARSGTLREVDDRANDQGDKNPKDDRTAKVELTLAAVRAAHSRQKIIAVFFGIFWF
jgi:hypothetical protein